MKSLVKAEFRCKEHERVEPACSVCTFLKDLESELAFLSSRRTQTFESLKRRLARREVTIIDLK